MSERFVLGAPLGRWQTNCYVVGDREQGTAVVIDPGEHGEQQVPALLEGAGVTCEAILLTHGHIDHIWAVPDLARRLDVPVLLHPDDRWIWDDPMAAFGAPSDALPQLGLPEWDPPSDRLEDVRDDQRLRFAGIAFDVRHNPGHTPGHVTFLGRELAGTPVTFPLADAEKVEGGEVLFSGDLLFNGSVGRTDFPRGSAKDLLASLATTVLPLEDDTLVLCGHGPDTSVGAERAANPFLQEALRHI